MHLSPLDRVVQEKLLCYDYDWKAYVCNKKLNLRNLSTKEVNLSKNRNSKVLSDVY